jgi:hypothetical protein
LAGRLQSKQEIYVLDVPKTYRATQGQSDLITVKERKNYDLGIIPPGTMGANFVFLYSTYPEYEPIQTATPEQLFRTEKALFNLEIATLVFRYGTAAGSLYGASHELNGVPEHKNYRVREESADKKYWVYPDVLYRRGLTLSQGMYFLPKETNFDVLISCADLGKNEFPPPHYRCSVYSKFVEEPGLACMSVEYRISAADADRWREIDKTVKSKLRSMMTTRHP